VLECTQDAATEGHCQMLNKHKNAFSSKNLRHRAGMLLRRAGGYTLRLVRAHEAPTVISLVGVLVLAMYTCYAKQQVNRMREAVGTAQRQLDATDRPWIKVTVSSARSSLRVDEKGTWFTLQLTGTNVGRTIALNIVPSAITVPFRGDGTDEPGERQADVCGSAQKVAGASGLQVNGLFPGEDFTVLMITPVTKRMVGNRPLPFDPKSWGGKHFTAMFVGCVAYRTAVSPIVHHTWFAYEISKKGGPIAVGDDLKAADIDLNKSPWFNGAD
jgi:hypothetical protein